MADLTFELHGEDTVALDDMGEGTLAFTQRNEATGRLERTVMDYGQLLQAVEALRPRYGSQGIKNTEPGDLRAA